MIYLKREKKVTKQLDKVNELEKILTGLNVDSNIIVSSLGVSSRVFGKWVDLGKGWKYQVHIPHGSSATKYHVYVKAKSQINSKKLNLRKTMDLVIGIGIFSINLLKENTDAQQRKFSNLFNDFRHGDVDFNNLFL